MSNPEFYNVELYLVWNNIKCTCTIRENVVSTYGQLYVVQEQINNSFLFELAASYLVKEVFKCLEQLLPKLRLEEIKFTSSSSKNTYTNKMTMALSCEFLTGNDVEISASSSEFLNQIRYSIEFAQQRLSLPKVIQGSPPVTFSYQDDLLTVFISDHTCFIKRQPIYLQLHVIINGNEEIIYLHKNVLRFIIEKWGGSNFSCSSFFTTVALDILVNVVNQVDGVNLEIIEWVYGKLPAKEYRMLNIRASKLNTHLLFSFPGSAIEELVENYSYNYLSSVTDDKSLVSKNSVLATELALQFPVVNASSILSVQEINHLQVGDVIMCNRDYCATEAIVDCGGVGLRVECIDDQLVIKGVEHYGVE